MPIDEFPWAAARVPPRTDATAADRLRIAHLSTLSLRFGLALLFGLVVGAVGVAVKSWEPMVVGFFLTLGCCAAAIVCALAAAFMTSRRQMPCPRGAIAGGVIGVVGLALLAALALYVLSGMSKAVA